MTLARPTGLRPCDRRRLRAGRRGRQGGAEASRTSEFAIIDVDQAFVPGKPANVQGLLFREQEVGYLVGYLAGLEEKRRAGKDVISAVGGMKEPPVDRFIAGYFAGAEKAAPGIETILDYSQDWDDQAKCKELALNQIARGSKRRLPGRGRLRPRRAQRGRRARRLGDRGRRRPVVPRPAHPHERAEGRRLGCLPHDRVDPGRQLEGRRQRDLRPQGGRRRPRQGERRRCRRRTSTRSTADQAADRGRRDHRDPDRGGKELGSRRYCPPARAAAHRPWNRLSHGAAGDRGDDPDPRLRRRVRRGRGPARRRGRRARAAAPRRARRARGRPPGAPQASPTVAASSSNRFCPPASVASSPGRRTTAIPTTEARRLRPRGSAAGARAASTISSCRSA